MTTNSAVKVEGNKKVFRLFGMTISKDHYPGACADKSVIKRTPEEMEVVRKSIREMLRKGEKAKDIRDVLRVREQIIREEASAMGIDLKENRYPETIQLSAEQEALLKEKLDNCIPAKVIAEEMNISKYLVTKYAKLFGVDLVANARKAALRVRGRVKAVVDELCQEGKLTAPEIAARVGLRSAVIKDYATANGYTLPRVPQSRKRPCPLDNAATRDMLISMMADHRTMTDIAEAVGTSAERVREAAKKLGYDLVAYSRECIAIRTAHNRKMNDNAKTRLAALLESGYKCIAAAKVIGVSETTARTAAKEMGYKFERTPPALDPQGREKAADMLMRGMSATAVSKSLGVSSSVIRALAKSKGISLTAEARRARQIAFNGYKAFR